MFRKFIFCVLFLSACQTPPSMTYQRSDYKVQRVGGLMVSTSPLFSQQEFFSTATAIRVEESWLAQNVDSQPVEIQLGKAEARIKNASYPLNCSEELQNAETIKVPPGEKVLLRCHWLFPKSPQVTSDLWVTFLVPTSSGVSITSNKIVRAEDFE